MPQDEDYSSSQQSDGFSGTQLRTQLDRILSSQTFRGSPRLHEFLRYVVNETLEGNAKRIKGFTIATEVFQRTEPEDAQTSTIVRVEAGRLRRLLADYYRLEGEADPIRIDIPKGAYVPSFEPVSIDMKEPPHPRTATANPAKTSTHSYLWLLAPAILVTSIFIALSFFYLRPPATRSIEQAGATAIVSTKPAIAVIPFEDATQDASGQSVAIGLTEDIITDLVTVRNIDVIALSSVLPYRGKEVASEQVVAELDVSHILRGSIRGTRDRLRITMQLIEVSSGREIWAHRADRNLENELEISEELALKVTEGLVESFPGQHLTPIALMEPIQNSEARARFKQAMNLANPPSDPRRLRAAGRVFSEVMDAAPEFAGGYAGSAYIYAFLAWWGHSESADEYTQKALALANKALELDPNIGLAYSALAFTHLNTRDFDAALTASSDAIRVQPNDPYVSIYHAFILCANGQPEQGLAFAKRAIRLDPIFPRTPYRNILGVLHFHLGQYQQALDAFQRNTDIGGPRSPGLLAYNVAAYALLGRKQEAKISFALLNSYNESFNWRAWLRRSLKNEQDANRVLQPLSELESD